MNRLARGLLHVPVVSTIAGHRLITLYVVGRTSGKHYAVPVTYVRHQGDLLLGSRFPWGANLRTGEPVEVRYRGRRRVAVVRVLTDEAAVVEHYAVIARGNAAFAWFNSIRVDRDGHADPDALHAAWAAGARGFVLTLRRREPRSVGRLRSAHHR